MKKILILLSLVFMLTGCSIVKINTNNVDNIINVILAKDNVLFNQVGKGYKYYVPREVNYLDVIGLNNKLYCNGNHYYLYIDVISYFHKEKREYKNNNNAFYSKAININDKDGYLEINKINNKYYIEFMYNYAKFEAYVEKSDIENTVLNASYILSTIKFNDKLVKLMLNDDYFTNREENYDIFTSKSEGENFLKYEEKIIEEWGGLNEIFR